MRSANSDSIVEKRRIAVLGSTGSIGSQALEVISQQKDFLEVELLCANSNADLLIKQAITFKPNCVVVCDESKYDVVNDALAALDIKVYSGIDSLCSVVAMESVDIVLAAMVGYAGLKPVLAAIKAGKAIALANKETLVVAGELVTQLARENKVNIYPVDSEHSAIFQCLVGEWHNRIEKIFLTASGGPFRGKKTDYLQTVTRAQALNHPNWSMGDKITIDSATMMNKGLEVIEAKWLFELKPEQLEVLIHPQSVIHSLIQFEDGSIKAQMGLPDMRLPIQFALTYPYRMKSSYPRLNFLEHASLTFELPDSKTFRNLALAYEALSRGGNVPCILNAANEVAVDAFLHDRIRFVELPDIVESCIEKIFFVGNPTYQDYVATDLETRRFASTLLSTMA